MLIVSLIILQVLIFVGMIFILKRVMTNNVILATKHLEELGQEYAKKEETVARQIEEAKQQSEDMIQKARQEADELKSKILKDANTDSADIMKDARSRSDEIIQQADKARERLLAEIDERVANSAIDRATELIHHTLPEKFRKDIHSQWVEELVENGFGRVERLNIPKDVKEIKIISAFGLDGRQRKDLSEKIKKILGREAAVKEEIDPKIVAGLVIHIGSLILDGSLKNKVQEQAKNAKYAISG